MIAKRRIPVVLSVALLLTLSGASACQTRPEKRSELGMYEGYSVAIYDGWKRTSDFLTLADGRRLAYDLFLPTKDGASASDPLPSLFKYTPYDRAWTVFDEDGNVVLCEVFTTWYCDPALRIRSWIVPVVSPGTNGRIWDAVENTEWLGEMLRSGYVVIVVDRPGTGASFGTYQGDPEASAREADEIIDWIAAQPWSDGSIGMFGDSIQAQIQYRAASMGNPHLKAILPATTWIDNYSAVGFPGGVPNTAFSEFYASANEVFDVMATPVDQDKDGSLLAQARAERQNVSALAQAGASLSNFPHRDTPAEDGSAMWMRYHTLYSMLDRINRSATPIYLISGWFDLYSRDNFLIYENLTVPKRLLVRPTDHSGIESSGGDIDFGAEAHRWFDYWLKGIDNGIMDEPPIHYYLQGAEKQKEWQSADSWPLKEAQVTNYYFGRGEGNRGLSVNNGELGVSSPMPAAGADTYQIDYTTTTGDAPLWSAPAMPHKYPDMRMHDSRSLTYTTPPLVTTVSVAGHPIVHIWLSTAAPDLDMFVYLEQVDAAGNSTYITEGQLRASHRLVGEAPFDNFGLPWRNHLQSESQLIPATEPVELTVDLRPTAWQFPPGSSIRITVAFADAGNFDTPVLTPAPTVEILRDADHPSFVEIPIVNAP